MQALAEGTFPADTLTERVLRFVREQRDGPFFLYWSHYDVHDPVRTRVRWLEEKSRRKLPSGAAEVRAAYGALRRRMDGLLQSMQARLPARP